MGRTTTLEHDVDVVLVQTHDDRQRIRDTVHGVRGEQQNVSTVRERSIVEQTQDIWIAGHHIVAYLVSHNFLLMRLRVLRDYLLTQLGAVVDALLAEHVAYRMNQLVFTVIDHVDTEQCFNVVHYQLVTQSREKLGE